MNTTVDEIYDRLAEVKDPEIPVLSLVDLGVITDVNITDGKVRIEMTPTFTGCPALDVMKAEIDTVLRANGIKDVTITINFRSPWSSDKITEKGRAALKQFGLALPQSAKVFADLEILEQVACPRCGCTNTELKSLFGSTPCRAIHYCPDCREAFEQFKPL